MAEAKQQKLDGLRDRNSAAVIQGHALVECDYKTARRFARPRVRWQFDPQQPTPT